MMVPKVTPKTWLTWYVFIMLHEAIQNYRPSTITSSEDLKIVKCTCTVCFYHKATCQLLVQSQSSLEQARVKFFTQGHNSGSWDKKPNSLTLKLVAVRTVSVSTNLILAVVRSHFIVISSEVLPTGLLGMSYRHYCSVPLSDWLVDWFIHSLVIISS